jgi:hypothetical protein
MTPVWKFLLLTLLVPFVAVAAWFTYRETRIPQNQNEALKRMIELQREGRYDKAVQVVQNWMNDSRRDISHDGLMYDQIAFVYIAKAYKRPATRDESARRAEENLQKAVSFFDAQSRSDLTLDPFEIGGGYEIMGDLSDKDKCRLYEKARGLFEQQLPLIKGDSYTAYGHTTQLEPVRKDVRKHLNAVIEKSSKANCQAH